MTKKLCTFSIYDAGVPTQCSKEEAEKAIREGKKVLVRCPHWGKEDEKRVDIREAQRIRLLEEISKPPKFRTYKLLKELTEEDQLMLEEFKSNRLLNPLFVLNVAEGAEILITRPDMNYWHNALAKELTKYRKAH
jgi:hypothetical protein